LRYLYIILFYLALPFLFLRLLWRSRRMADYRKRWSERLGFCPFHCEKSIWLHAASVGETIAAIPLVKTLQTHYPDLKIVITNMTITGAARTKAAFGDSIFHAYIPYDVPDAAARFLKRINPVIAIFMETELWPNIFYHCKVRHIPVFVANARLSQKSAAGYQRIASLTREMLEAVKLMGVQTQLEADRFIQLGLTAEKILVTGSIKFDVEVPAHLAENSQALRAQLGTQRLIWIAGSTHETEEEIILNAHRMVCAVLPGALLILVPRHPARFDDIFKLSEQKNFKTARRSREDSCNETCQVYLADTMGELLLLYSVSDIAFVGGSFAPVGGHNMLEAAVLGKPVVTGTQLFNFAHISKKLIESGGMLTVNNADELAATIINLLKDKQQREKMGAKALDFVNANRGALAKHIHLAAKIIDENVEYAI
jgi:3-deoxy-D-manno-octulosonic-acid transferase